MQKRTLLELKMISEYQAKKYCKEELSKIENYDKAIADTSQIWDLHHRTEIWWNCSSQELIDNDCYYNRKACELIFLTHAEHTRLHNLNMSEDRRRKMSDSMKGKNVGKFPSEETRKKLSESRKGKTPFKGHHHSEEAKKKLSKVGKGKTWKLIDGKRVWLPKEVTYNGDIVFSIN